jgi:hypothetical protein
MVDVSVVLSQLEREGAVLFLEGDSIRLRGAGKKIDPALLGILKSHREEVFSALRRKAATTQLAASGEDRRARSLPASSNQSARYAASTLLGRPIELLVAEYLVQGEVDLALFRQAYELIVKRHEILRTRYRLMDDGALWQFVEPAPSLDVDDLDLSTLPREAAIDRARSMTAESRAVPIDLHRDLPLRARIIRLSQSEFVFAVIVHPIAMDGMSWSIFLEELRQNYTTLATGAEPDLAPLPHQYADYAQWENERSRSDQQQRGLAYWDHRLRDAEPLVLAGDDDAERSSEAVAPPIRFSFASIERLRAFAKAEGVAPGMIVTAGLCFLLGQLGRQTKVVIASINGGRPAGMKNVIGPFVRTSPYCIEIREDPTFGQFAQIAKSAQMETMNLQWVPSADVRTRLQLDRLAVEYVYAHTLLRPQTFTPLMCQADGGPMLSLLEPRGHYWKYFAQDAYIGFTETPGGLSGTISHAAGVVQRAMLVRLAGDLPAFLEAGLRNPTARLSQLLQHV